MSVAPPATFGVVEDSDEDFIALSRVVNREAPGTTLTRWRRAEDVLATLAADGAASFPNILIVDLSLPGIDGCELVRRLRDSPATRLLPVFVLSGSSRQLDIDRCYDAGANAFLTKPGSSNELGSLLQLLLRSLTIFRRPTPLQAEPVELEPAPAETLDQYREDYERQLVAERDAERRARQRAENLQRIASRLSSSVNADQIRAALTGELIGSDVVQRATLNAVNAGRAAEPPLFMPNVGGTGMMGQLAVVAPSGAMLALLEVRTDDDFDIAQQEFLVEAADLAGRALDRVARGAAAAAPAGAGATASDLPMARWLRNTLTKEMQSAVARRIELTVVAIEFHDLLAIAQRDGAPAADEALLRVSNTWREVGYDLLARSGGEEFAAVLAGVDLRRARMVVAELRQSTAVASSVGIAQWDGRESPTQLLARADAAMAEDRRARAAR